MSSRYNGRRASVGRSRRRGVNPVSVLVAILVLILAVILVVFTLKKGSGGGPKDPDPMEDAISPDVTEPDEPTPAPIARIEVFGDTQQYDSVYRVGDTGYEMYTYSDEVAKKYAICVNKVADNLAGTARVFTLCPPLSSGITLPDDLYDLNVFSDQKEAEKNILGYLDENVIGVPLNEVMMQHRTEYVFYRTDHHWSSLGAYYAYTQFCDAAGFTAHDIGAYKTADFPGFLGSFYNDSGKSDKLSTNPDTVTAYYPVSPVVTMSVTEKSGNVINYDSVIYDETEAPASLKYGAFISGDNPYTVMTNESMTDGSSCVVIKESFGNAFVPFLPDHYQTVYVIDYRYWTGSLTEFVKTNGVDDVIFCNNLSALRNNSLMGQLYGIL